MHPALAAVLFFSLPLFAATPYHLVLEANPAAAFPYLGRFGSVELHVYQSGVRAEALWLNSFSRNGSPTVTVLNPLGRMYVELPVRDIAPTLAKLAGNSLERSIGAPVKGPTLAGSVSGIAATRHRLVYGPSGWIDVWTTSTLPENPQLRRIVEELVRGISPNTANAVHALPGIPIYVELTFSRFKKLALLKVKKLTFAAEDEKEALEVGSFYMRGTLLEKLLD